MNRTTTAFVPPFAILLLTFVAIALTSRGCTSNKSTTQPEVVQRTFASPDDALTALVAALRAHDTDQLEAIFGPGNDDLLFSGDPVDDRQTEDRFVQAYDEKHQLVNNDDKGLTIVVGNDDWPMPIPIIKDQSGNAWVFDTDDGKDEVIDRRVGRNELTVIQVCKAICDAQREYAQRDPNNDAIPEYARKFISDPGTKNGLYWPTAEGEAPCPLGELCASAQCEGYSTTRESAHEMRPYHGYLYRILTAQGKDAPGGAEDYIVKGKFIGGYAIVAWPVNYRSSGITTFIANYKGDVYQKDLGEDTDKLARAMTDYNPDSTWKQTESGDQ
jgi:hypothetical protein